MENIIVKYVPENYSDDSDIKNLVKYISGNGRNKRKENVYDFSARGLSCNPEKASDQIINMQKNVGKAYKRRIFHFIVSYEKADLDAVKKSAEEIADELFKDYQLVYGIHTSTFNPHIHFAVNRVSRKDGTKMHWDGSDLSELRRFAYKVSKENGIGTFI